jgi:hypothetical protein
MLEEALGPDHPDVANVLNTLGRTVVGQGRYAEAEALHQRSARMMRRARGDADVQRIRVQSLDGPAPPSRQALAPNGCSRLWCKLWDVTQA